VFVARFAPGLLRQLRTIIRRIALHGYDPPETEGSARLSQEDAAADGAIAAAAPGQGDGISCADGKVGTAANDGNGDAVSGTRAAELHKAAAMGLLVDDEVAGGVDGGGSFGGSLMGDESDDDLLLDDASPLSRCCQGGIGVEAAAGAAAEVRVVTASRPRRWADEDSSDDDDDLL
jgi:hypothetical protein